MASASDLVDESLRRLLVNGVYWGLGLDVPAKADVTPLAEWIPSKYSNNMFHPGLKAEGFVGLLPPPLTVAPAKKKKKAEKDAAKKAADASEEVRDLSPGARGPSSMGSGAWSGVRDRDA